MHYLRCLTKRVLEKTDDVVSLKSKNTLIESIKHFYRENPDKTFLENTLKNTLDKNSQAIIQDIVDRNVWKKIYEKNTRFLMLTFPTTDTKNINKIYLRKSTKSLRII